MKKILIFGLGFQAQKYVKYFENKGYEIESVTKSGINKNTVRNISKIYKSEEILKNKNFDFSLYRIIILAINPAEEQEKMIKFFLENDFSGKIIVEKPVSNDIDLLNKLIMKNNIYYFFDELVLHSLYKKIFNQKNDIYCIFSDYNKLEHLISPFLLFENFYYLLYDFIFKKANFGKEESLFYKIIFKKYTINFKNGNLSINLKHIKNILFSESLDYVINLDNNLMKLIKINFYLYRLFLSKGKDDIFYYSNLKSGEKEGCIFTDIKNNFIMDFVFLDDKILFGKSHSFLSKGKDIYYAGQIIFKDGKCLSWNNGTGHYKINSFDILNRKKFEQKFVQQFGYNIENNFIPYPLYFYIGYYKNV